jgi:hypothetical protein
MPNAFDPSNYPTTEPELLRIGDRWAWRKSLSDYPVADYTLTYEAVSHGDTPCVISITATDDGTDHLIEVGQATTLSDYEPGVYAWTSFITRDSDSERITLASGTWTVERDPASDAADPRSTAKKALDDCEAILLQRSGRGDASYTVGDRSLTFKSTTELIELRDYWRREYERERQNERIASGKSARTTVGVRF